MTITVRANLKALRIRPAREPGDKPVLEVVLRTEVDPTSFHLAAKAGKEMTVEFIPDPELQPSLPLDELDRGIERVTTVEPDGIVASTEQIDQVPEPPEANGVEHEPGWAERAGVGSSEHEHRRRRRGTRSSERTPSA
jgi:hypothetical protein